MSAQTCKKVRELRERVCETKRPLAPPTSALHSLPLRRKHSSIPADFRVRRVLVSAVSQILWTLVDFSTGDELQVRTPPHRAMRSVLVLLLLFRCGQCMKTVMRGGRDDAVVRFFYIYFYINLY